MTAGPISLCRLALHKHYKYLRLLEVQPGAAVLRWPPSLTMDNQSMTGEQATAFPYVRAGSSNLFPYVRPALMQHTRQKHRCLCMMLSRREASGRPNLRSNHSGKLDLSEGAVKLHVHNIFQSFGVSNRSGSDSHFVVPLILVTECRPGSF